MVRQSWVMCDPSLCRWQNGGGRRWPSYQATTHHCVHSLSLSHCLLGFPTPPFCGAARFLRDMHLLSLLAVVVGLRLGSHLCSYGHERSFPRGVLAMALHHLSFRCCPPSPWCTPPSCQRVLPQCGQASEPASQIGHLSKARTWPCL